MRYQLPLVSLILAAAAPAWAVVGASATVTRLTLTVHDLDLGDGIEASFSFADGGSAAFYTALTDMNRGHAGSEYRYLPTPFGPDSTMMASEGAWASSFMGSTFNGGGRYMVSTGSTADGEKAGGFDAGSSVFTPLLLTPNTAVTWSGDYSLSAWTDPRKAGALGNQANAWLSFGEQGKIESLMTQAGARHAATGLAQGSFAFTLTNAADYALVKNGTLRIGANGGLTQMPVVPEPQTYAMLLAGAGVIGFAAKRRRS